jgi:hypothetical protein
MELYCDECKCKVEADECLEASVEKNRKLSKGTCPNCGKELDYIVETINAEI